MANNLILGAYCENAISHISKAIEASNNNINRLAIDEINSSIHLLNRAIQSAQASEEIAPDNPLKPFTPAEPSRCDVCASPLQTLRSYRGKRVIVCPKCGPVNLSVKK